MSAGLLAAHSYVTVIRSYSQIVTLTYCTL